ncbi:hypothetical protein ACFL1M_03305 [Patescibacteria group bacterium]
MAVVAVAFDGTRWADGESRNPTTPYGGDWYDSGGGTAASEPDFIYQNTYSVSEKVKATELGIGWVPDSAVNMTSTKRVLILKTIVTTVGILETTATQGANIEIGSGGRRSAYYEYYRYYGAGTSPEYPSTTSWIITAVDPNLSGYADNTTGSPSAAAINWVGWVATMTTTTAKSENVAMDAIDYITNGTGHTLTGGTSTDPDGTFQDFADYDEGTQNNRYGIVTQKDGIFYVVGVLTIGSSTETDFTDSNQVLVFPDNYVDTGFCGVDIGLQNASSVINMSAVTMVGRGSEGADGASADSRPDWGTTGTSGTATLDGMSFQSFNDIVFTSGITVTSSTFVQSGNVDQSGATISTSTFDNMTDAASVLSDDPELISNCVFVSDGSNHAFEADTTGTYDFIGHSFTGYATSDGSTGNEVFYNNSGGLITLNASGITGTISVRNAGISTTVVNTNVTLEVNGVVQNTQCYIVPTAGGASLMNESASEVVSGDQYKATQNYNYSTPIASTIRTRELGYLPFETTGTINDSGLTVTAVWQVDPNFKFTVTGENIQFTNATSLITRTGNFTTDGWLAIMSQVTVEGSANNDGTYELSAVGTTTVTITGASLTDEGPVAGVTLTFTRRTPTW